MRLRSFSALVIASASLAGIVVIACSEDSTSTAAPGADASPDRRTGNDGGIQEEDDAATGDDGSTGGDAGKDAKAARDANGPGEAGTECIFNHDCQLALRCGACDAGYCFCEPGVRGTGKNGVDTCDAGEHCESALCVESDGDDYYCSGECDTNGDCKTALPRCLLIPSFGAKICSPN